MFAKAQRPLITARLCIYLAMVPKDIFELSGGPKTFEKPSDVREHARFMYKQLFHDFFVSKNIIFLGSPTLRAA